MSRMGIGAACALTFPRAAAAGAQARGVSENLFPKGTFFDIHAHLAQGWVSRAPLSVASLLKWMDARGIAQAAVLPLISPEGFDYPVTTEYVLTETKPHRDRLVPFCDIDPRTGLNYQETRDLLQKYQDAGARGLGEHKCGIPIDDPRNLDLFRACGEAGLPVLVHIDNMRNMDTPGLPGLAKALAASRGVSFIGHAQGFWSNISGNATQVQHQQYPSGPVAAGGAIDALLDRFSNLYCDLSAGSGHNAIARDPDFGRAFVLRRASRLLFGTDYLADGQEIPQFALYKEMNLPADVEEKVFRGNRRDLENRRLRYRHESGVARVPEAAAHSTGQLEAREDAVRIGMISSCLHRAMTRIGVSAALLAGLIASGADCAAGPQSSSAALPAPVVVDVWTGPAPDDIGIEGAERTYVHDSVFVGPTKLVTNVTKPTLTIYRPPSNRNTGTAMIICPGGGYRNLYWELEGEEVAAWLVSQGITGIILKYRVPFRPGETRPPPGPIQDAQRAMRLVRSRAAEWGIDPKRIGMVGFSAGGHLAIATATNFDQRQYKPIDVVDDVSSRPDFAIGCYSGYLKADGKDEIPPWIRIPAGTPPILLAHASDDDEKAGGSNVENSVIMYLALRRANVPTEMHIFASGNHDFGVRQNDKLPSSWPQLALRWLRSMHLLSAGSM